MLEHGVDLDAVAAWLGRDGPNEVASYTRPDGHPGHELRGMDAAPWLEERIPSTWTLGIVHEAR